MGKGIGKRMVKCAGFLLCALLICFNSGKKMSYIRGLSGSVSGAELANIANMGIFTLSGRESLAVGSDTSESLGGNAEKTSVLLFGMLPIKELNYYDRERLRVMPGGESIGVSIYTNGALVVGVGRVNDEVSPAAEAGIRAGDIILCANGQQIKNSNQLETICADGGNIALTVKRDGTTEEYTVTPEYDAAVDAYRAGMWVRDSTSGIGTLSFWNMSNGRYGALGHPITDIDTGSVIEVKDGSIVSSDIIGVAAGANGVPGEMIGSFSMSKKSLGSVELNCEYGLYGEMKEQWTNPIYPDGVQIALPGELHEGPAEILCTVDGSSINSYSCEIVKLYPQDELSGKGMVIKVTDKKLIDKTGGIVQGMSGSPVLQDGKLAGAVTHVFVNNSRCGYCIYACWMNQVVCEK